MTASAPAHDAVAAFESVAAGFLEAVTRRGIAECTVRVAGRRVLLRFAGDALVDELTRALTQLEIAADAEPELTIDVWDTTTTGVRMPFRPWRDDPRCVLGEIPGYHGERVAAVFESGADFLHLVDRERGRAVSWVGDSGRVPFWVASFPFRLPLHCWLRDEPYQLVHAGAVGLPDGGVLIAGRSGSGKSTTTLACLGTELRIAGDDYVLVGLEPPTVHGLFGIAKVEADNVGRIAGLAGMVDNESRLDTEKAMIALNVHAPEALSPGFPLRAIVLPRVTGEPESRLRPARAMDALQALAPTTVLHLRADRAQTLAKLGLLARSVPTYWLDAGTDLERIPQAVMEVLR